MKLKELKRGDYFTLKSIDEPTEKQVYIRGDYDRTERKYECNKFSDVNYYRYISGDKEVYTNFIF